MKKVINSLKQKNIICGYLYAYVHFITEIACFYSLSSVIGNSTILWLVPLIYDACAFVPQSIIGYFSDKHPNVNVGVIGSCILFIGIILLMFNINLYLTFFTIAIGNAFIHVAGAELTLNVSSGKLSHSAIFVGAGSFGVITGKLLYMYKFPIWILLILIMSMIPFILLANSYRNNNSNCLKFKYHNKNINSMVLIILITLVVIVRGYTGYGIPKTWNKSIFQTVLLYFTMGLGKMLGGVLADSFGMKKIAIISVLGSIPFLIIGDNLMLLSLIGVMLFSMTMSITLGLLVSVLKKNPGLAFGFTTIGLFLGSLPLFFVKITSFYINSIIILILSIICVLILNFVIRKDSD